MSSFILIPGYIASLILAWSEWNSITFLVPIEYENEPVLKSDNNAPQDKIKSEFSTPSLTSGLDKEPI